MNWRYGIVKYYHKSGRNPNDVTPYWGIGELYFEKDPLKPFLCTEKPIELTAESDDDPVETLTGMMELMLKDIKKYPPFDSNGPFEKEPSHDDDEKDILPL
jgi:hypothetical protein